MSWLWLRMQVGYCGLHHILVIEGCLLKSFGYFLLFLWRLSSENSVFECVKLLILFLLILLYLVDFALYGLN